MLEVLTTALVCYGPDVQVALSTGRDLAWDVPPSIQELHGTAVSPAAARGEAQASTERRSEDGTAPWRASSPPRSLAASATHPLTGVTEPQQHLLLHDRATGVRAREATLARLARKERDGRHAPAPPHVALATHPRGRWIISLVNSPTDDARIG